VSKIRGKIPGITTIITISFLISGCLINPKRFSICEIQGSGPRTPYLGKTVILQGVISVDLSTHDPPGFFLQGVCPEETGSRGVLVSLDKPIDWISTGDQLRMEGIVEEKEGETTIMTSTNKIEVLSTGEQVDDPVNLADQYRLNPFIFNYEDWEGRVVFLPESLVLKGVGNESDLLLCPSFSSNFSNNLCILGQPFFLSIKGAINHPGLFAAVPGDMVADFVGVLRQGSDGYYIQIMDAAGIRVRKNPTPGADMANMAVNNISTSFFVDTQTATQEDQGLSVSPTTICTPTILPSITPVPSPTWYPVNILISEILPNPQGDEPDLEWVEIFNPNSYGIPLTGVKLSDAVSPDSNEGALRFPDGWYIESDEVLVIANKGVPFQNWYGFFPDFEIYNSTNKVPELLPYPGWSGSRITLSNSGDEFLLIDPWDVIIDQVAYGKSSWSSFYPPVEAPGEGSSLERCPPDKDQDRAGDWQVVPGGSPGKLDCSHSIITASITLLPSPSISSSPFLTTTTTPNHTITPFHSQTVSPFPSLTASPSQSYTIVPFLTATITPSLSLTVTSIATSTATPIPSPTSTPSPGFTVLPSQSPEVSLSPNPSGTLSQSPTGTPSPSLSITPTQSQTKTLSPSLTIMSSLTPIITSTPVILINEIHADPHQLLGDANGDGKVHSDDDEFLELVNSGSVDIDLSGWQILDEVRHRFTFPDDAILKENCGFVVFGGDVGIPVISGSRVFSTGSLGLNNQGDTIILLDSEGDTYLSLSYGPDGGQDQSLTRFPDLTGELPLVLHSEILEAVGRLFSPGVRVDGTSFGDCP